MTGQFQEGSRKDAKKAKLTKNIFAPFAPLRELPPDDSEYSADDELSLRYAEEVLHGEVRYSITTENEDRQRNRMPATDQQLERPTDSRADQCSGPKFSGIAEGEPCPANSLVQAAP